MKMFINKRSSQSVENSVFLRKDKYIRNPIKKILYFLIAILLTILLYISGIGCVWRFFFHIPCPGCGITTAFIKFFHGEFEEALKSNYMFLSLPVIFLYIIFDGRIFKSKWLDYFILILIMIGFLVHWVNP